MSQVQFIKRKYIVPVLHEGFYQVANINRTVVYRLGKWREIKYGSVE